MPERRMVIAFSVSPMVLCAEMSIKEQRRVSCYFVVEEVSYKPGQEVEFRGAYSFMRSCPSVTTSNSLHSML